MRLPFKGSDYLCVQLNPVFEKLQGSYLEAIKPAIAMQTVSAMIGDGTVTQAATFDPRKVHDFYHRLAGSLRKQGWDSSDVLKSETEDLRRLYCQTTKQVGKYHLAGYFGIQFHALPYYRVDKRVIEIQKELVKIADEAGAVVKTLSGEADKVLQGELQKKGYADLGFHELFTKMFDDEKLVAELDRKAASVEKEFPQFEEMRRQKSALFTELNDLLIEMYQTAPVSIDHNRLMQGEEGVTTYFDIEQVTNKKAKKREPYVNTAAVPNEWVDKLCAELDGVTKSVTRSA